MPDFIKFPLVLIIVVVVSAVSLTLIYRATEPARIAQAMEAKNSALKTVLPNAEDYKELKSKLEGEEFQYFEGIGEDGKTTGYAASSGASGYSSVIRVMVGVDSDYKIKAIKVLSQKETPGLGDKINEVLSNKSIVGLISGKKYDEKDKRPWFQHQFNGRQAPVKVKKDGGEIDAITGATISSRAVCEAVNKAVERIKEVMERK